MDCFNFRLILDWVKKSCGVWNTCFQASSVVLLLLKFVYVYIHSGIFSFFLFLRVRFRFSLFWNGFRVIWIAVMFCGLLSHIMIVLHIPFFLAHSATETLPKTALFPSSTLKPFSLVELVTFTSGSALLSQATLENTWAVHWSESIRWILSTVSQMKWVRMLFEFWSVPFDFSHHSIPQIQMIQLRSEKTPMPLRKKTTERAVKMRVRPIWKVVTRWKGSRHWHSPQY